MAEYRFWISEHDAIVWHLPSRPEIGNVVDFGDRGRWVVTETMTDRKRLAASPAAAFLVRPADAADGEPINDPLRRR